MSTAPSGDYPGGLNPVKRWGRNVGSWLVYLIMSGIAVALIPQTDAGWKDWAALAFLVSWVGLIISAIAWLVAVSRAVGGQR